MGRALGELLREAAAVEARHHDVADDEVELAAGDEAERFDTIFRSLDAVACLLERERHEPAHMAVVFDDENLFRHGGGVYTETAAPASVGSRMQSLTERSTRTAGAHA